MTNSEFSAWLVEFCQRFPSVQSWIKDLEVDTRRVMQEEWREVLRDVDSSDASIVTRRMFAGDLPLFEDWRTETLGAHVKALCRELVASRKSTKHRSYAAAGDHHSPLGPGAGELFQKIVELLDANPEMSPAEAAAQVIPPASGDDGPRYHCHLCRDAGTVMVWNQRSVRAAQHGQLDIAANRSCCGVPCSCTAGDRWIQSDPPKFWHGWTSNECRYSKDRYCLCLNLDVSSERAIADFKDWCATRLHKRMSEKREPAFDDFNAGQ